MKKVKEAVRKEPPHSQVQVKYEQSQQSRDNSSVAQPVNVVIVNRRGVEVSRSQITSGSQSTSTVVVADNDMGNERYRNKIAASQTGLVKFQETRLLSTKELRRRALKALKKAEERRKQILISEEEEIDL